MIKPPYTKWINDIKTKLGFNRTMTASGEDVVDAVNKLTEKADKPIIVTVTVDASGASMSAADQAKFTPDMIMCGYSITGGSKNSLKSNVTIRPGQTAGTASVEGTATAQVVFKAAFIHTANS